MSSGTRPKGNCGRPWQAAKPINRKCSALTEQLDRPFAFLIKALLFLPHDVISGFLFAKPLIRGVAQGIAAGPFGKFDLRDQLRFDPDRITPRQIGYGLESRLLLRNRLQLFKQACGFGPVEPGPDLAGKDQVLFIVDTDQHGAKPFGMLGLVGETTDNEFLLVDALLFEPSLRASRAVNRIGAL